MKYVVGYIDFFNNELILELIEAENEHEARWKHSKLQSPDYADCIRDTVNMDNNEFQQWCFNCDMLVSVLEVT